MQSRTLVTGLILALVLGGIGGADYLLKERGRSIVAQDPSTTTGSQTATDNSSSQRSVKKGTQKKEFESVESIVGRLGFTLAETRETSLLQFGTPVGQQATTLVLLSNNDRAALFAWVEHPDAKITYIALKQQLQSAFSNKLQDLIDERIVPDDGAPMDMLSFLDPVISAEKIMLIRSRNRIYEFHVAEGQDTAVESLMQELTK